MGLEGFLAQIKITFVQPNAGNRRPRPLPRERGADHLDVLSCARERLGEARRARQVVGAVVGVDAARQAARERADGQRRSSRPRSRGCSNGSSTRRAASNGGWCTATTSTSARSICASAAPPIPTSPSSSSPVADWTGTRIIAYVPETAPLGSLPVQVLNEANLAARDEGAAGTGPSSTCNA